MTDLTLPSSQAPEEPLGFASIPDQLSLVADALEPFAKALHSLPLDIRRQPGRNLADVLGICATELSQQLTVNDLMKAAIAFALVSVDSDAGDKIRAMSEIEPAAPKCRVCGCSHVGLFGDPTSDVPYRWVEADLCSFCASRPALKIVAPAGETA